MPMKRVVIDTSRGIITKNVNASDVNRYLMYIFALLDNDDTELYSYQILDYYE